ncbi:aldehyde dehydrogenase family protein, partial [Candidatus Microgenomates bacterium]
MPHGFFDELHDGKNPPQYKWFDGENWVAGKSGEFISVISPIDNSVVGKIPEVAPEEMDAAIARAQIAQKAWAKRDLMERSKIVRLAGDWIREHEPYMTTMLVKEIGKPTVEAKDEIVRS